MKEWYRIPLPTMWKTVVDKVQGLWKTWSQAVCLMRWETYLMSYNIGFKVKNKHVILQKQQNGYSLNVHKMMYKIVKYYYNGSMFLWHHASILPDIILPATKHKRLPQHLPKQHCLFMTLLQPLTSNIGPSGWITCSLWLHDIPIAQKKILVLLCTLKTWFCVW